MTRSRATRRAPLGTCALANLSTNLERSRRDGAPATRDVPTTPPRVPATPSRPDASTRRVADRVSRRGFAARSGPCARSRLNRATTRGANISHLDRPPTHRAAPLRHRRGGDRGAARRRPPRHRRAAAHPGGAVRVHRAGLRRTDRRRARRPRAAQLRPHLGLPQPGDAGGARPRPPCPPRPRPQALRPGGRRQLASTWPATVRGCVVARPAQLDEVRETIRARFGYEARFDHFPIVGLCHGCADTSRSEGGLACTSLTASSPLRRGGDRRLSSGVGRALRRRRAGRAAGAAARRDRRLRVRRADDQFPRCRRHQRAPPRRRAGRGPAGPLARLSGDVGRLTPRHSCSRTAASRRWARTS